MNAGTPPPGPKHVPVMPAEVLEALAPAPGNVMVDATLGGGGHARLVLDRLGSTGRLIGLERDPEMIARCQNVLAGWPLTIVHSSFARVREVLDELNIDRVDGLLADLGFSSDQMDWAERGFSFSKAGPLDMRMDRTQGATAADLINTLDERALADLFWRLGEERFSRRIAGRVVATRRRKPIESTTELADLVRSCVPRRGRGIDPATRVFQALRIAVNDELSSLDKLVESLPTCLRVGGRAVIISFHSLEDRRVKQGFRDRERWEVLTAKPVLPSEQEVADNPRARSAKMRAACLREAASSKTL